MIKFGCVAYGYERIDFVKITFDVSLMDNGEAEKIFLDELQFNMFLERLSDENLHTHIACIRLMREATV